MSKPEMELHMINLIYGALPMHAQTEKTTFSCKDDYIGVGAKDMYIEEAHMALDIFRFAVFLIPQFDLAKNAS